MNLFFYEMYIYEMSFYEMTQHPQSKRIEYILERNLNNLSVWIFSVPFILKESSKCTNHVNVYKLYAVEYINTVCFLDYSFQFRIF